MLSPVDIAAIGRPTSKRLAELGHPPQIVPEKTTFRDMLEAILDFEEKKKRRYVSVISSTGRF
jgi:uroporphyrinogen-III synthase